jgi:hypothetical protein
MSGNIAGDIVRVSSPAPIEVRSWRSLWRKRWVMREHVIFAGMIESGSLTRGLNQPARASIQAVDALASFQESRPS